MPGPWVQPYYFGGTWLDQATTNPLALIGPAMARSRWARSAADLMHAGIRLSLGSRCADAEVRASHAAKDHLTAASGATSFWVIRRTSSIVVSPFSALIIPSSNSVCIPCFRAILRTFSVDSPLNAISRT